jgi:hypothetical protein
MGLTCFGFDVTLLPADSLAPACRQAGASMLN